jgi:hypothetical protein
MRARIFASAAGLSMLVAASSLGGLAGCSSSEASLGRGDDAITDIPETPVKEQLVGNCWIYATLGWVESLHLAHTGEELNLSESYFTYLHWFMRLTSDRFVFDVRGDFNTGDFFGYGEEIIARYGLMDEGAFISTEADVDRSARQEAAERVVKEALEPGGDLATKEQRSDPANVRAVLNRAFALPASVSAKLTRAFGAELSRTRGHGATLSGAGFRDPAKIVVAPPKDGRPVTLDDAVGELDPDRQLGPSRDRGERRGALAWVRVPFGDTPEARAATTLRLKKALNAGFPVPIDWYPAWASMRASDGSFHEPMDLSQKGGWHSSLVHDYEVTLADGTVLAAGTPVHDPALLARTLEPDTRIEFLRFKNSWGRETGPLGARGFTDATWLYLATDFDRSAIDYDEHPERGAAVDAFILPPDSWEGATH